MCPFSISAPKADIEYSILCVLTSFDTAECRIIHVQILWFLPILKTPQQSSGEAVLERSLLNRSEIVQTRIQKCLVFRPIKIQIKLDIRYCINALKNESPDFVGKS